MTFQQYGQGQILKNVDFVPISDNFDWISGSWGVRSQKLEIEMTLLMTHQTDVDVDADVKDDSGDDG